MEAQASIDRRLRCHCITRTEHLKDRLPKVKRMNQVVMMTSRLHFEGLPFLVEFSPRRLLVIIITPHLTTIIILTARHGVIIEAEARGHRVLRMQPTVRCHIIIMVMEKAMGIITTSIKTSLDDSTRIYSTIYPRDDLHVHCTPLTTFPRHTLMR